MAHPQHVEDHDRANAPDPQRKSWAILALALVAQVLVVLDISVFNTALPTIGADLQLRSGDLQWLVTAYLLMSGGGLLPGLLVLGVGVGVVFVAVSITAMAGIPAQHAGMASGFLMTGPEIGAALGVAVLAAVATAAGDLTTPTGAAAGFSGGFLAAAGIAVGLAVVAFLAMPAQRATGQARLHMH